MAVQQREVTNSFFLQKVPIAQLNPQVTKGTYSFLFQNCLKKKTGLQFLLARFFGSPTTVNSNPFGHPLFLIALGSLIPVHIINKGNVNNPRHNAHNTDKWTVENLIKCFQHPRPRNVIFQSIANVGFCESLCFKSNTISHYFLHIF